MARRKSTKITAQDHGGGRPIGLTIRFGDELQTAIEECAEVGKTTTAEIVRVCVREALPVVREAYAQLQKQLANIGKGLPGSATKRPQHARDSADQDEGMEGPTRATTVGAEKG